MADKTWKRVEREKCRALGGERSGPTGRDLPDCDDAVAVALEIKAYKKLVFLSEDWQQAVDNAAKVGKMPVLNVREGGRGGRDIVQMTSAGFESLWLASGLGPIRMADTAAQREGFARINWDDFVRLYRAVFNNDNEE
jgi:hypothetical protein